MSLLIFDIIFAAKSLDAPLGVYQLLFSREKRMTVGAYIEGDFLFCGTSLYFIAARTCYRDVIVFRMNILLQLLHLHNKDGGACRL